MSEMSPILVNHGITVTPRYSELTVTERAREGGKFSRCVTLKGSFTFAAADGSSVVAEAYGESIDTGDKATIKAQTVAFRTVLFQQFIVPLMSMDSELDGDGEPTEAERLLDEWIAKAKATTTDKDAASVWAEGGKVLKDTRAYTEFRNVVAAHRNAMKAKEPADAS